MLLKLKLHSYWKHYAVPFINKTPRRRRVRAPLCNLTADRPRVCAFCHTFVAGWWEERGRRVYFHFKGSRRLTVH